MKIMMAIPTWNRAPYLDKAIAAIAAAREQAGCEVTLFVSDNCSDDATAEVCAHWMAQNPWITCHRWDTHVNVFEEVLRRLFTQAPKDYDYMWIQGDDDFITDPTAFAQVAAAIAASPEPPALVHACQTRRAVPGDDRILAGTLAELANEIGWLELLGWLSSLIVARATIERTLLSDHWEAGRGSAFTHAELLLEAAHDQPALVLGAGLMDPQDEQQTQECLERWKLENVGEKYWVVLPNLLRLQAKGVFALPLSLTFFRYHTYSLWDRFATEVMACAGIVAFKDEVLEIKLELLGHFANLLGRPEDRKILADWLDCFADEVWEVRRALRKVDGRIERCRRSVYSFKLLPPE